MEPIVERGLEAAAAGAGERAVRSAMAGKYRKALIWAIPLFVAGTLVWYVRRGRRA